MTYIDNTLLEKQYLSGIPIVLEREPITVARIGIGGESLIDSILLHPRYVPQGMAHEIIDVRGMVRGRGIYVLLDEPIAIEGVDYNFLNFKGSGADADRRMVLHPTHWYGSPDENTPKSWVPRHKADHFGRTFGSLRYGEGVSEFRKDILPSTGAPYTPNLRFHRLPIEIGRKIDEVEGRNTANGYSQIVKACRTDIRMDSLFVDEQDKLMFYEDILKGDIAMIASQLSNLHEGNTINYTGTFCDNRYATGEFTDYENYELIAADETNNSNVMLPLRLIMETLTYLPAPLSRDYLLRLQQATGLPTMPGEFREGEMREFSSILRESIESFVNNLQ